MCKAHKTSAEREKEKGREAQKEKKEEE